MIRRITSEFGSSVYPMGLLLLFGCAEPESGTSQLLILDAAVLELLGPHAEVA